ncbi:hypothetical protein N7450_010256 [Penicillium hetheringtonii]|uniref:Arrestin C-terminal-like domain-containing protein n=1 Tax=Penicillium hetheringtonii TaxID=911720 RepID=A0AAD6DCU2_9EURO|nr:hypothetical protein N7450_010256 [Penicillium hetheringtonii]
MQNGREYITSISEQPIGSSKKLNSFQLTAGDYQFPFSIPLSGQMLETITGLQHSYHTYHVQAIIERRFRGNSIISRDLRIYQSPDPWADHQISFISTTIERQSDHEIQYCITIPDSNIPFGSKFPVKCFFSPLTKNLKPNTITLSVIEKHNIRVDATAAESAMHNILTVTTSRNSTIFESEHNIAEASAADGDDESRAAEWSLDFPVQLPADFDLASQSISTRVIKISHELAMKAHFENTETGTPIIIDETIPFSIYMTPAVIGDDGAIHGQDMECFQENENAPPAYGQHKCDAIPPDWEESRQLSGETLQMEDQQELYQRGAADGCIPIAGVSLESQPPAYQFCST